LQPRSGAGPETSTFFSSLNLEAMEKRFYSACGQSDDHLGQQARPRFERAALQKRALDNITCSEREVLIKLTPFRNCSTPGLTECR
jgi:hypothetical protein